MPVTPTVVSIETLQMMSGAALRRLEENPATNPDTTSPTAALAAASPVGTAVPLRPPTTKTVPDAALSDDAKHALEVLVKDGMVEQTGEHSWRFR